MLNEHPFQRTGMMPIKNQVFVNEKNSDHSLSKSSIWVENDNFYGAQKGSKNSPFLVIGFDTEYKTPDHPLDRSALSEGLGRNKVLSYQVYCKVFEPGQANSREWGAVCYPEDYEIDNRLSLSDMLRFAVWKGIDTGVVTSVPDKIYLVGHFTRADIPAFSDFKDLTQMMSSVRNTFLSIDGHIAIDIPCSDGSVTPVKVILRDTMLLTPASSKSLKALGELVGQEKIELDADPKKDLWYKQNMDVLLKEKPDLFEHYALNDAVICLRYAERMIEQSQTLLGSAKLPATLTSIGVDLLWKSWEQNPGMNPHEILGKEVVTERRYNKKKGYFENNKRVVDLQQVAWDIPLATDSYHGGRNEQFWFGPAFEDDWTDYDLASAYPTAMAMIGMPDWRRTRVTNRVSEFTPETLGVACVDFEFPKSVRFPTLPVRTDNGLLFPRKGTSNCAAPEIALAKSLGAKLVIRRGVIIPYKSQQPVFGQFIADCLEKRRSFPKGSLENLFWKELSNSSYGKTAQGLREKRVFDLRERSTKPLPPSKITNPYFAAYITSFVRSVLGEILNSLPEDACVFSCTTDGFLTNATSKQMEIASIGPIAALYRKSRAALTGDPEILEIKHRVRQPLGWRTRGQATLKPGTGPSDGPSNIVLAKGGIFLPEGLEDASLQNDYIVGLFFNRKPDDLIQMKIKTSVRDMMSFDADLVDKSLTKRLSMEFDWKRKPRAAKQVEGCQHVAFSTDPWDSVDQFLMMRQYWEQFAINSPFCLKTVGDYRHFATYVMTHSSLGKLGGKYLRKAGGDIKRLRQSLSSAWRHSKAGLIWQQDGISNTEFADILTKAGIPASRADVENGTRKAFEPKKCPPTPAVYEALYQLLRTFPSVEVDAFVINNNNTIDLISTINAECAFLARTQ